MKTHYVIIPITESEQEFDEGEGRQFLAKINAPNGRSAAGFGTTKTEAVKNLINAKGPITESAIESYIEG